MPGLYPRITGIQTRVTLLDVPEATSDSYGQPMMTANAIGEFYATIIPLLSKAKELMAIKQVYPQATYVVTIGRTDNAIPKVQDSNPNGEILARMKLQRIDNNHIYNIITAEVDPDTRGWVLVCEKHEGATT